MAEDGTPPPRIVADLSGVTFMDSSGINVFVAAHRCVSDAQGWLLIAGAQESVVRLRATGRHRRRSSPATPPSSMP
jgi:stage II sporulation protein AA (anti-sigma F factor antagonist)